MKHQDRAQLEADFLRLCRLHGLQWIESIIRPLGLPGKLITVRDIPCAALLAVAGVFGREKRRVPARQR
jgi:hypothetical protein